jgi:hypothetical protein
LREALRGAPAEAARGAGNHYYPAIQLLVCHAFRK